MLRLRGAGWHDPIARSLSMQKAIQLPVRLARGEIRECELAESATAKLDASSIPLLKARVGGPTG